MLVFLMGFSVGSIIEHGLEYSKWEDALKAMKEGDSPPDIE
jgi:hypothetical protein